MSYLIAQILICLLIAAAIGFLLGWLIRGVFSSRRERLAEERWSDRFEQLEARQNSYDNDTQSLRARFDVFEQTGVAVSGTNFGDADLSGIGSRLGALESRQGIDTEVQSLASRVLDGQQSVNSQVQALAGRLAAMEDKVASGTQGRGRPGGEAAALLTQTAPVQQGPKAFLVEDIEGIGRGFGAKLRAIGIETTLDLLENCANAAGVQSVAERTGIEAVLLTKCASMADLMRIAGVGSQNSELLEASGVASVQALANRDAASLTARMAEVNARARVAPSVPDAGAVADWVRQARSLPVKLG